jgi:hypothetical protein
MGVEAKGSSAAQNKAAVRGMSGVLGSLRDKIKGLRSAMEDLQSALPKCRILK